MKEEYQNFKFTTEFCLLFCRLGFTYLRLKDNYMEILNRDNDIER